MYYFTPTWDASTLNFNNILTKRPSLTAKKRN